MGGGEGERQREGERYTLLIFCCCCFFAEARYSDVGRHLLLGSSSYALKNNCKVKNLARSAWIIYIKWVNEKVTGYSANITFYIKALK